jgi:hypothetical protein
MIAQQTYGAHSARVEMRLILNGKSLSVTHTKRETGQTIERPFCGFVNDFV